LDLRKLAQYADIGILTGSDIDYVNQQMEKLIKYSELRYVTHLLPCNGTKHYRPPSSSEDEYTLIHNNDMSRELPSNCLGDIFKILTKCQSDVCYYPIPLTGHFINYRGSMINWSPIGRNANSHQREAFVKYDRENDFRASLKKTLETKLGLLCPDKVSVKLGGDTSFDIYPKGWDKTYALRHFEDRVVWFVGDRCEPSGNDYEIYNALRPDDRSFNTKSPLQTGWIIREEIIPQLKHP
jgi:phosphomannomutase